MSTFTRGFILIVRRTQCADRPCLGVLRTTGIKPRVNVLVNPGRGFYYEEKCLADEHNNRADIGDGPYVGAKLSIWY